MSFNARLKKFFEKNDPQRLYIVRKIVRNFRNDEESVMNRLEEIYSSGGPSKLVSTRVKTNPLSYSAPIRDNNENIVSNEESSTYLDENTSDTITEPKSKRGFLKNLFKKKKEVDPEIITNNPDSEVDVSSEAEDDDQQDQDNY